MAVLRFDRAGKPRFEAATNVRLTAVCNVANTVRDHLARLLDREIALDVFEPVIVPLGSQPALFSGARVFLAHARRSDLLVVFREADARRTCACAFREDPQALKERELSTLEEQVLERIAREVAHLCAPLCGEVSSFAPANGPVERYECATYFELRLGSPVDVVIGLGLAKDPAPTTDVKVSAAALDPVPLNVRARVAHTRMTARDILSLGVGSVVAFDTALADGATLLAGNVVVARGECGARNGTLAFNVSAAVAAGGAA